MINPADLAKSPMVFVTADNGAAMVELRNPVHVECSGGGLWRRRSGNIAEASRVVITAESPGNGFWIRPLV